MRTLLALIIDSPRTAGPQPRDVLRLALLVVALAAGAAHAQDRLDALAAAVDRGAATPRGETATVERMAAALARTPAEVRASRAATRLGWGDLFIAHRLATRGGHPLEKVVAARRTGTGWSEIAEEAHVDAGALAADVAAAWPDVARAVPSTATPPAPTVTTPAPTATTPAPAPSDDIRDRMIRGGGTRH